MRTSVIAAATAGFIGSSAFAADVPIQPAAIAAPSYSWAGLYAGVNLGGAWTARGAHTTVIGGGQLGYNWQFGSLVVGAETDIQGMALRGSARLAGPFGLAATENASVDYLGTVRGRIGLTRDRWLTYTTAGLAYTTVHHEGAGLVGITGNYSALNDRIGYALGSGIERPFLDRWSAKAEFLFARFPGRTNTYTTTAPPMVVTYEGLKLGMLRFGLNYRFVP
jgi:outer membrane immunogenic protein